MTSVSGINQNIRWFRFEKGAVLRFHPFNADKKTLAYKLYCLKMLYV